MGVIRFSAVDRGELPTWLPAGFTFHIANNFQQYPRRLTSKGEREESLDGTPEGYMHALQREFSIVTDFVPIHERDVWRAFFTSVANAEQFQIDFAARQLLQNPGFEQGNANGWGTSGGGTGLTVNSNPGLQALGRYAGLVTLAINGSSVVVRSPTSTQSVPALPDQVWLGQGLAKRDESSVPNRDFRLFVTFYDSGGAGILGFQVGIADDALTGYQLCAGECIAPASSAFSTLEWFKATPAGTNEAGRWLFDEHLLALLTSWTNVWLVDNSVEEQQIGGVGVQYRFRVKSAP